MANITDVTNLTSQSELTPDARVSATDTHVIAPMKTMIKRSELSIIADYLEDEYDIGAHRDRPRMYRRYATLRLQELFTVLATLYSRQFQASWPLFKRLTDAHYQQAPGGVTPHMYAALSYISCWIWDTYVTLRASVMKISSTAFNQYYHTETIFEFGRYDPFLQQLNALIRPSHVQLELEDTLFIPLFPPAYWNEIDNPWRLNSFNKSVDYVQGLIEIMENKNNNWEIIPFVSDTLGRPTWLLDWHQGSAYAWFPQEGNYTREDLIVPYILGIPLTPRLAPRDTDSWQSFPGGALPANIDVNDYERVDTRAFYGSAEYRTLQHQLHDITDLVQGFAQAGSKRPRSSSRANSSGQKGSTSGSTPEPQSSMELIPNEEDVPIEYRYYRFRLIDWCNYARVIMRIRTQNVNRALRSILFRSKNQ
uniref:Coat protein n=1 Tax=Quinoa-associated deltapartitivirus 1 TaxID=2824808 RepID=A0A8D9UGM2_9VIRU|nr:TPA_asm: coat protein [Quinoa-associated deltapartitivirus 1]